MKSSRALKCKKIARGQEKAHDYSLETVAFCTSKNQEHALRTYKPGFSERLEIK